MSNSLFFRNAMVSSLMNSGFSLFGGAVRDMISGDFFKPEWSGDLDFLVQKEQRVHLADVMINFLAPNAQFRIQSVEVTGQLSRVLFSFNDEQLQCDFVSCIGNNIGYDYTGIYHDDREFLDLDVNGLVMWSNGAITLRSDVMHKNLTVHKILEHIANRQFHGQKELNSKRYEKAVALVNRGWTWIS